MIERLFPDEVVTVTAEPAMWDLPLPAEEATCVARAAPKRRREFTAGRACARQALSQLDIRNHPLGRNEDRTPIWPVGIAGSISHCAGFCGVAVARIGAIRGVGFDVEEATPLKSGMLDHICTPGEREVLAARDGLGALDWGKIVFSAKESFYKCYFPIARTFLGFHDAEIDLAPDGATFIARIIKPDAPAAEGHRHFHGRIEWNQDHVFTGVTLEA